MRLAFLFIAFACACNASPLRTNLLTFTNTTGEHVVRTTSDWNLRRASILSAMQTVMGPLPGDAKRCSLDVRVEEEVDCGTYVRRKITYASEPNSRVPAYLLIPKTALAGKKTHGILTLHQTHALGNKVVVGLGKPSNDVYGVELAERGYVCLSPAYPLLANYNPDWRALGYESGTMKAIWDNIRGLDLLESLPFVEHGKFVAIGHSLGAHNSIYTAAFDQRIKVIVSSCGFDSYVDYKDGNITGWTSDRYMPRLKTIPLKELPFDFPEILAALSPRAVFVNAPLGDSNFKWRSVDDCAAAARPVFALHGVSNKLRIEHPDCPHEFPKAMREAAYDFIDKELR